MDFEQLRSRASNAAERSEAGRGSRDSLAEDASARVIYDLL
jgi:hypothetical protein